MCNRETLFVPIYREDPVYHFISVENIMIRENNIYLKLTFQF